MPVKRVSQKIKTPYYEKDGITLYLGSCFDIIPLLQKAGMDLLLTDPPYGVNFKSNKGKLGGIEGDSKEEKGITLTALNSALKCLRPFRHLYIFGGLNISTLPITEPVKLIWDKEILGMGNLESTWGPQHEEITFSVYVPSQKNRKDGYGNLSARIRKGSVLREQRTNNSRRAKYHPNQKPISILRQMIESSTVIGETVFDPFVGSGSTLVAAKIEGRKAIGIELEEKFCKIAVERLEKISTFQGES